MNKVGVNVLSYNTKALTLGTLKSIFERKWQSDIVVCVVDNNSGDGTAKAVENTYPKAILIKNKSNLGFSTGNNIGIKKLLDLGCDYILLLNSDTSLHEKSLDNLVDFAIKNSSGITSCKLLNTDGSFQPNGGDLPKPFALFNWISGIDDITSRIALIPSFHQRDIAYFKKETVGWVAGTAMLISKDVFSKAGVLDSNIFMYVEDVDFCWRAQQNGIKVGWTDKAQITHIGGASSTNPQEAQWTGELKGIAYLYKKHYGIIGLLFVKLLTYIFVIMRIAAFTLVGRRDYAKSYANVLRKV